MYLLCYARTIRHGHRPEADASGSRRGKERENGRTHSRGQNGPGTEHLYRNGPPAVDRKRFLLYNEAERTRAQRNIIKVCGGVRPMPPIAVGVMFGLVYAAITFYVEQYRNIKKIAALQHRVEWLEKQYRELAELSQYKPQQYTEYINDDLKPKAP